MIWLEPDRHIEATGDGAARRAQDANRAGNEVLAERYSQEREAVQQMLVRLQTLRDQLLARIMRGGTNFQMAMVRQLASDVDRMIADATAQLALDAEKAYEKQAELGEQAAIRPMQAAKLMVAQAMPGIDRNLVQSAFDNTVDLLTMPMQQFGTDVKVAIRRVATAGDGMMGEILKLREKIEGQGFDAAGFKAERIIRTEVGRVFNDATYARLSALSKDFPFLRKGWRAAADNRTRLGHREAAKTYKRGSGIPMAAGFVLNVYDERNGKAVKLIGQASLRFPLDPQASPAGRIAAGATIMCRCNAFADFDIRELAKHQKATLALAIPPVQAPPVAPPAAPPVAPMPKPAPIPKPVKPRIRTPKVKTHTGTDVLPQLGTGQGADVPGQMVPGGKAISSALTYDTPVQLTRRTSSAAWGEKAKKFVQDAYALLDSVHGDGDLARLPVVGSASRGAYGAYWRGQGGRAYAIGFKQNTVTFNTVFHETGHWLDHVAIKGPLRAAFASEDHQNQAMDALRQAFRNSKAVQTLRRWSNASMYSQEQIDTYKIKKTIDPAAGHWGDGQTPDRLQPDHLKYLLTTREVFARAYAQYVAKKAGGAALAELKMLQRHVEFTTSGQSLKGVKQAFEPKDFAKALKAASAATKAGESAPQHWTYPNVWQDEDFVPIEKAFDELFESMGWRVPKAIGSAKGGK